MILSTLCMSMTYFPGHRAKAGEVFYVPANKIHKAPNNGEKDVIFLTCKDVSHGLHGAKAA